MSQSSQFSAQKWSAIELAHWYHGSWFRETYKLPNIERKLPPHIGSCIEVAVTLPGGGIVLLWLSDNLGTEDRLDDCGGESIRNYL